VALIVISWFLIGLFLNIMHHLTYVLIPQPDQLTETLMDMVSGTNQDIEGKGGGEDVPLGFLAPVILMFMIWIFSIAAYLFVLLVHLVRIFGIYMLVWAFPFLIALDYGEFPVLHKWANRLYSYLPLLAFMTIPQAVGLHMTLEVFGSSGGMAIQGFPDFLAPAYLFIPAIIGIATPLVMFMKSPAASVKGQLEMSDAPSQIAETAKKPIKRKASEWNTRRRKWKAKKRKERWKGHRNQGDDGKDDKKGGGGGGGDSGGKGGGGGPGPSSGPSGKKKGDNDGK
jgi:uncharacterized membrane protein YgcG